MKLEKIIDIFGKAHSLNLVIKRSTSSDTSFKAYKTIKIELYSIVNKKPELILDSSVTDRIIETNKDSIINNLEVEFLNKVFKYYAGNE